MSDKMFAKLVESIKQAGQTRRARKMPGSTDQLSWPTFLKCSEG